MYNSDTVYSTTVFRPVSLSPSTFPDRETPPPQRTRKLETPLHFDGGLFSDIRSSDGKLLSKVTVDRMHSSTRRDVVDTPHVSETSDAFGNKDYVDDIVKTETITNEDVFKVKFTPVSFELDGPQQATKSLERPRTPVIRPTLIDEPITPLNVPMTLFDRSTTPIDRPITPLNVPMTLFDRSTTPIDRPITPLNVPMTLFDRSTTPIDRPITPIDRPRTPVNVPMTFFDHSTTPIDRPITPLSVPMTLFDRPTTPVNRPITPLKIISNDYEDLQSYKIIKTLLKEHSNTKADNLNYWDDKVNFTDVKTDAPVKRAHSPLANFIVSEQLTKIDSYLQENLNVYSENSTEIISKPLKLDEERETKKDITCSTKNEYNITTHNYDRNVENNSNNVKEPTVKDNAVEEIQPTPLKVNSVKAKRSGVVSAICNMPMHYHAAILCFFLIVYNLIYQYIKQNHHGIKK
ncbi:Zonadhesin [Papilio xuthus]|uniref:Zonadhesin n=1 Tax=Papilio xuthus TaxID=66420 RepID=A0A194PY74_PAPXU|nr:Zonadhesin [Papilio xuthus]